MKWRTRSLPKPKAGDVRSIRRFAWWPTETVHGLTLWLTFLRVNQILTEVQEEEGEMETDIRRVTRLKWVVHSVHSWQCPKS